ncbi:conserved hypothetical protein [uncultured Paludibacter sp.]|uniref:DUF4465 domain-containing protein n=1 Tax=uncultured Paludibacter sp. TaxID=497635 RepID=A0A653ADG9_9BACT|nr:conserved hypothetical protein [uncultured Paludibacter sp.]
MKKNLFYFALFISFVFVSCEKEDITTTLNLESKLAQSETEWTGDTSGTLNATTGEYFNQFTDGFFIFDNYYNPAWESWSGFAYTNKSDVTTTGYKNNSAITGKAATGKVYVTANINIYSPAKISFNYGNSFIIKGMYVTNSTYAYLSMKNGDSFAKKFTDGDWFKLEIIGTSETGQQTTPIEVYLADFRDGKTEMLNTWKWIDTQKLGKIKSISFSLSSSDNGQYGMNTPSYFCLDGIQAIEGAK